MEWSTGTETETHAVLIPMSEEAKPVDVEFLEAPQEAVAVTLDEAALKRRERLEEIEGNEKLGVRSIKIRLSTFRALKKQIDSLGIKMIGHCKLLIADDKVESVLAELDGIAKEIDEDRSSTKTLRMEVRRLKLDCIKMMMASGNDHLRAERQPSDQPATNNFQIPFPAGTPIAVAIGTQQADKPKQVE